MCEGKWREGGGGGDERGSFMAIQLIKLLVLKVKGWIAVLFYIYFLFTIPFFFFLFFSKIQVEVLVALKS